MEGDDPHTLKVEGVLGGPFWPSRNRVLSRNVDFLPHYNTGFRGSRLLSTNEFIAHLLALVQPCYWSAPLCIGLSFSVTQSTGKLHWGLFLAILLSWLYMEDWSTGMSVIKSRQKRKNCVVLVFCSWWIRPWKKGGVLVNLADGRGIALLFHCVERVGKMITAGSHARKSYWLVETFPPIPSNKVAPFWMVAFSLLVSLLQIRNLWLVSNV